MMQLCASAAKLRGGGPILIFGVKAMGMYRVTATSDRHWQFAASEADERRNSLSLLNRYWSTESCRRAQRNALRDVAGRDKPRDEQLAGQRYDHGRALLAGSDARLIPLYQGAVLLMDQKAPGQLDRAATYSRVARFGETLFPSSRSTLFRGTCEPRITGDRPSVP